MTTINKFSVVPVESMAGDSDEDTALLKELFTRAFNFLSSFKWCQRIISSYFGMGTGGIYAVFLFEVKDSASPENKLYWVVAGDLPPAYLAQEDDINSPDEALEVYVDWMDAWVEAVRQGRSVADLMPVDAPPNLQNAAKLASRIEFLKENFINEEDDNGGSPSANNAE